MKPYIHAKASVHKVGHGDMDDYLPIHNIMDWSKKAWARASHRLVMHNAYGCYVIESIFGEVAVSSDNKQYSPRDVAEFHCLEDMQNIHTVERWCSTIPEAIPVNKHPVIPSHQMADHTHEIFGGEWSYHMKIHKLLDDPYFAWADGRSRAIMHHTTGVEIALQAFPDAYDILIEHLSYELGSLPNLPQWVSSIPVKSWMGPGRRQAERMKKFA